MSEMVTVAAIQLAFSDVREDNVARVEAAIRQAATAGAQVILPSELFESPYFPQVERPELFALAHELHGHPTITRMQALARELRVVIPVSYFEKAGQAFYNSLVVVDADGEVLGNYRKSHIPDGPGYEEKYYFAPGDTGFCVWNTRLRRSASGSAGTSGTPKPRAAWCWPALTCFSTRLRLAASRLSRS